MRKMSGTNESKNNKVDVWNKVLKASLSLPGAKIGRNEFLTRELTKYCNRDQLIIAIESSPSKAALICMQHKYHHYPS